ncbi:unnamed protein product, partial [Pylaiella littoralis]
LSAEAERQASQLWGDGIMVELALASDVAEMRHAQPRTVFDNALTEEGFLGFTKDLDLLALPFATHTGFISLFRQYASDVPKGAARQSRAKGLFNYLCKSSDVQRLGNEDIARLLDALGLPSISEKDSIAYTYADGTWDFYAFSRHLHHQNWVHEVDEGDQSVRKSGQKSSSEREDSIISSSDTSSSSSDSSDQGSSTSVVSSAGSSASAHGSTASETFVAMKRDGFEKAMEELACAVRPACESCECEGCRKLRGLEVTLQSFEGSNMANNVERISISVEANVQHISWATIQLYSEVLAPNAERLSAVKASGSQDVFGAAWFSSTSRKALCRNEQMLREIFLALVGRQGDRDALTYPTSTRGGAQNQPDDDGTFLTLKRIRADCMWVISLLS